MCVNGHSFLGFIILNAFSLIIFSSWFCIEFNRNESLAVLEFGEKKNKKTKKNKQQPTNKQNAKNKQTKNKRKTKRQEKSLPVLAKSMKIFGVIFSSVF